MGVVIVVVSGDGGDRGTCHESCHVLVVVVIVISGDSGGGGGQDLPQTLSVIDIVAQW